MAPEKIVGLAEVAELYGVSKHTAVRWTKEPALGFPEPLARLASGPVWERRKVEAWAAKTLPLRPGRPAKRRSNRKPR